MPADAIVPLRASLHVIDERDAIAPQLVKLRAWLDKIILARQARGDDDRP
jgi:hypothetical protein